MQESSSRPVGEVGQTPTRSNLNETIQYGCAAEPIHQLGTVQSHGLVMVIDINTLCVVQFSEGWVRHFTPQPGPESILGSKVDEWFDLDADAFRDLLLDMAMEMRPTQLDVGLTDKVELGALTCQSIKAVRGGEVLVHRIRQYAVLEWTPTGTVSMADMAQLFQLSKLNESLAILRRTQDESTFFSSSASLLQKMSGFDRVMIYRFMPDYSGEVVAESVSTRAEVKYVGMRFPAGDIPAQARRLYLRTLSHLLADVEARPDQLYPAILPDGEKLDQTYCSLRQMSASHLTYLHNMGVRASMSISLIQNGQLWGLVACHHMSPKVPPFHVRELMQASCELISNVISMRIEHMERLAHHEHKARLNQLINLFGQSLTESENALAASIEAYSNAFLDFFDANHWLLKINTDCK